MSYAEIINLSLSLAVAALTIGSVLTSLVFVIWAMLGQRGEPRTRRLRIALTSLLVFVAAVLTGVSIIYFVTLPGTMHVIRPEFTPPYKFITTILSIAGPVTIFAAAALAAAALVRSAARRKRMLLASLCLFLLFAATSVANYQLIYSVQVPAYERYSMIESREWLTQVGGTAPAITVTMLDGAEVRLSDLRGKVVLLNFFATWCGPCLSELPHLQELWNEWKSDDDFRMLVINRQESPDTVVEFLSKNGFSFPVAVDRDASAFNQFAKEGIPRTYLISREGIILFQTLGYAEIEFYQREMTTLRQLIDEELKETP